MHHIRRIILTVAVILAVAISGCSNDKGTDDQQGSDTSITTRGEHDRNRGGDAEGEESGTEYALDDIYHQTRNGARLILAYNPQSNSFEGMVQNTTERTLERVRVEVHLSNGIELGPTIPSDMKPGETKRVSLKASSKPFDGWSAHPEVGNEEEGHGQGGEHDSHEGSGEHGSREGRGEHGSREGRREHN